MWVGKLGSAGAFRPDLAFILFVMTPGAQTVGKITVYGAAKQLVI